MPRSSSRVPMLPVLVPVLAQVVVLGASDQTEARLEVERGNRTLVGSTTPAVQLTFEGDFLRLGAGYGPQITLRPLDSEPRELRYDHAAGGEATVFYTHRFRRTVFAVSESAVVTLRNPRADVLGPQSSTPGLTPTPPPADPTDPPDGSTDGGTPTEPSPTVPAAPTAPGLAPDQLIFMGSLTTTAGMSHEVSARTNVSASASHQATMGLNRSSRRQFPLVLGETVTVSVTHALTRRDDLSAALTVSHAVPQNDDTWAWVGTATGTWGHRLSPRTQTNLSAGVSTSYTRAPSGLEAIGIFPAFGAGIQHTRMLARGTLGLSLTATSSPTLDFERASVDPQIGVGAAAGWARDRTNLYASLGSAISLEDDQESFNSITATTGVSYDIGAGFSAESGVRAAWQTFGGRTLVPPSWALFIGVRWAGAVELYRGR